MREIAAEAGVATETLYAHFSSKRRLLEAVIDIAVVGDTATVPVAQRPEFAALGHGSRGERLTAAAHLLATIHERTAAFAKVIREAAPADEQIADVLRATRERQRQDVAAGFALIADRPPTPAERDGLWAVLSPDVYLLLAEESGWSVQQYETWLEDTLERLIPRS
jgi:AcrR family transcriptional regulator